MNKKFKKILFWTTGALLVCVIGVYFALDNATNYVLQSLASSAPQSTERVTETAKVQVGTTTQSSNMVVPVANQDETSKGLTTEQVASASSTNILNGSQTKALTNEYDSVSVDSQLMPKPTPASTSPTGANITPEQAQKAQEEITLKDKTKVTSVLLSKLSASDIKLFMKMSESGVSSDEKKEAKKIILQKLTEEEYDELIAIAAKLGLSASGKSYQDSLKE